MNLKNYHEININNYQNQNLRGKSFKGKNLAWANFSNADIRGADFTGATLIGADFCGALAGLQAKRKMILVLLSFILSGISGFLPTLTGFWIASQLTSQKPLFGITFFFIMLAIFLATSVYKDLLTAITIMPITFVAIVPIVGVVFRAGSGEPTASGTGAGIAAGIVIASIVVVIFVSCSQIVDGLIAAIFTVTGATIGAVTATTIASLTAIAGLQTKNDSQEAVVAGIQMAVVITIVITLLSIYIAWVALPRDKNFNFIRSFAINFAAMGGTSFRNADLTETDFTRAKLKSTDFRRANITRTRWYQANLESAKLDGTILNNSVVRELLVTLKGNNEAERFVGLDFHGANLSEAELVNTNFTKANFSDAILTGAILVNTDFTQADLSRVNFVKSNLQGAILTKALALGTIFSEAKLTGVCLESWVIDHTTLLEDSFCDFVYIKEKEPYPSSGKFLPGDFAKLFQEVVDTVDLIFHNGINKEAFVYSWHQIQVENDGINLDIQGIERKSDDIVVVKVNVPEYVNKSKIHAEFTKNYDIALKAIEDKYQALLESKQEEVTHERQEKERLYQIVDSLFEPFSKKDKVVLLDVDGDFINGFTVTLNIEEENRSLVKCKAQLPPNLDIEQYYHQWQSAYRKRINAAFRIEVSKTQVTNRSDRDFYQECLDCADRLKLHLNNWLNSKEFSIIKEQIFKKLNTTDSIRFILQTDNLLLRRIPWHLWNFFDEYSKAEIGLSNTSYAAPNKHYLHNTTSTNQVRILAIIAENDSETYTNKINVNQDKLILEQLTDNAEIVFLPKATRKEINELLWHQTWDILYFAGHSSSSNNDEIGYIYTNSSEKLTIADLKYALSNAIENGLKLAIFNSCDGMGLAINLATLRIPQIIVMREWVPDEVAQDFLRNFFKAFRGGKSLYQSVRDAREQLHHWENKFPCATWLPVIFQNPAEIPPTWNSMLNIK